MPTKWTRILVACGGIAALALSVLACLGSLSWSPDGSKLAYAYFDGVYKQSGIAVYDRNAETVTRVFLAGEENSAPIIQTQWARDGETLLVLIAETGQSHLVLIPADARRPVRMVTLPSLADQFVPVLPAPEVGGVVYIGLDSDRVAAIDVKHGVEHVVTFAGKFESGVLISTPSNIFYMRNADTDPKNPETEARELEFGVFDPKTETLEKRFNVTPQQLESLGIRELNGPTTARPGGHGFAMVADGKERDGIVLFSESGIERFLIPKLPTGKQYKLGTVDWGSDKKLYATAQIFLTEDVAEISLAQLAPESDAEAKLIPIAKTNSKHIGTEEFRSIPITASPDRNVLALNLGMLDDAILAPEDAQLYVVDIRGQSPKVQKIVLPAASDTQPGGSDRSRS